MSKITSLQDIKYVQKYERLEVEKLAAAMGISHKVQCVYDALSMLAAQLQQASQEQIHDGHFPDLQPAYLPLNIQADIVKEQNLLIEMYKEHPELRPTTVPAPVAQVAPVQVYISAEQIRRIVVSRLRAMRYRAMSDLGKAEMECRISADTIYTIALTSK